MGFGSFSMTALRICCVLSSAAASVTSIAIAEGTNARYAKVISGAGPRNDHLLRFVPPAAKDGPGIVFLDANHDGLFETNERLEGPTRRFGEGKHQKQLKTEPARFTVPFGNRPTRGLANVSLAIFWNWGPPGDLDSFALQATAKAISSGATWTYAIEGWWPTPPSDKVTNAPVQRLTGPWSMVIEKQVAGRRVLLKGRIHLAYTELLQCSRGNVQSEIAIRIINAAGYQVTSRRVLFSLFNDGTQFALAPGNYKAIVTVDCGPFIGPPLKMTTGFIIR